MECSSPFDGLSSRCTGSAPSGRSRARGVLGRHGSVACVLVNNMGDRTCGCSHRTRRSTGRCGGRDGRPRGAAAAEGAGGHRRDPAAVHTGGGAVGAVERANRTVRVECWSQYRDSLTCAAMNKALDRYLDYYNDQRRHRSLRHEDPGRIRYDGGDGCLTPNVQKVGEPHSATYIGCRAWRKARSPQAVHAVAVEHGFDGHEARPCTTACAMSMRSNGSRCGPSSSPTAGPRSR